MYKYSLPYCVTKPLSHVPYCVTKPLSHVPYCVTKPLSHVPYCVTKPLSHAQVVSHQIFFMYKYSLPYCVTKPLSHAQVVSHQFFSCTNTHYLTVSLNHLQWRIQTGFHGFRGNPLEMNLLTRGACERG